MADTSVRLVTDREEWESFVHSRKEANFLQSWNWGLFHENLGKKVFRFCLYEGGRLTGIALAVKEVARRGTYFAISGGPIPFHGDNIVFFLNEIKKTAKEEKCDFIRLRPQELDTSESRALAKTIGLVQAPLYLTADLTLQLDLNEDEEGILKKMRKNTRYEIRRTSRVGIEVKVSKDPTDIKEFYDNQVVLAKRKKFVPFSYKFLHEQFKVFVEDDNVLLFHAYKDGKLLASVFVIFYNREAVYHYGVSTPNNLKMPGAHACLWAAIKEAKRRDFRRFNFWGITPKDQSGHRFSALSVFKRGFGGREVSYLPAHDMPLNKKYIIIRLFELARKKLRRL